MSVLAKILAQSGGVEMPSNFSDMRNGKFKNGRVLWMGSSGLGNSAHLKDENTGAQVNWKQHYTSDGELEIDIDMTSLAPFDGYDIIYERVRMRLSAGFCEEYAGFKKFDLEGYANNPIDLNDVRRFAEIHFRENWQLGSVMQDYDGAILIQQFAELCLKDILQGRFPDFAVLNDHFGSDFMPGEKLLEISFEPDGTPAMVIDA